MKTRLLPALILSLTAAALAGAAPVFQSTLLFPGGENDRPNHRIPSLTRAKNGDLLAIVEKRNSGIGDVGDTDIVMRRSTDNGRTWGGIETVFDDGISTCTDITTVVTDAGPDSSRIFLFFLKNKKKFACIHSDDHGATWATAGVNPNPGYEGLPMPFVIHDQVTVNDHAAKTGWDYLDGAASNNAADQPAAPGSQAAEWERDWTQRYGIGPGNAAIQLKRQPAPALNGRILVSARHRERAAGTGAIQTWAHVFHSDDAGATWQLAPAATRILQNGSESQLIELPDGAIYLNLRNETAADRAADATFRYVAVSTDGGATWAAPADAPGHKDTRLVSTVCHAAVELYENPANPADPANGAVLFANPFSNHREEDHPYGRYRMSIRLGTTAASLAPAAAAAGQITWGGPKIIYPHPASYADLAILANGEIGLIYERGDPGTNSYWSELHFARFNLEWLNTPDARPATVPARLANLFSEGMVLQRGQDVPLWGYASAGDTVTIAFAGQTRTATADADGRWVAVLDPMDASATPRDMTVTGPPLTGAAGAPDNIIHIGNILVGDVWLASGQSNMNWDLNMLAREHPAEAPGIAADLAAATHLVRQFEALGATGAGADTFGRGEPDDNVTGVWTWSSPSTLTTGNFSATAWYFAREIHERTGVPVGIINATVGGTVLEAWADPRTLDDPALAFARTDWPGKGRRDTASNLYNALVAPLAPVALKGFLWYQGEHNAARPADYAALFTPFIHGWRARFDAPSAPFYFVQLPNFSISDDWVGLRAAQATALALPATGMAVAIDIGNDNNIHPGNKRDVGLRLARLARHHDYGETALEYSGPVPGNVVAAGSQLVIAFDHAAGLHLDTTKNRPGLPAFEIAAATGAFFPATPALEGRILRLFAPEVPAPHRARYAWHNTPSTPLYNAAGLPAAPFSVEAGLSPSNLAPPGDQTAAPGQQITLRADIAGDATAAFIRWQVSIDGVNWRDIDADSGLYTGETTAALVIKAATAGMDGLLFRYLAGTTADNAIPSPTATLSVALALLQEPKSLVADQTGDLYVAEAGRIWRVRPGGGAYVFSPPAVAGGSDGAVYGTPFFNLAAIALHSGTLYAANAGGDKIDTVSTSGSVTTFTGAVGFPGSTDGPLAVARFNYPSGLAFAPDGTLYVADTANRAIRKIHPNGGGVTTLAGIAADSPVGLAVSQNGDRLYVADAGAHVIRSVSSFGWDTAVLAGDAGSAGCAEGAPGQARFDSPRDLLIAGDDTLYVVDTGNSRVLEILPDGSSRTIVGSPEGETGFRDGSGTSARFDHPGGITMDSSANLYIADTGNGVLRRISPADEVTTLLLSQTTPPAGENNNSDDSDSDSGGGGGGGGGAPGAWFFFAGAVVATMRIACRRAAVKIKN